MLILNREREPLTVCWGAGWGWRDSCEALLTLDTWTHLEQLGEEQGRKLVHLFFPHIECLWSTKRKPLALRCYSPRKPKNEVTFLWAQVFCLMWFSFKGTVIWEGGWAVEYLAGMWRGLGPIPSTTRTSATIVGSHRNTSSLSKFHTHGYSSLFKDLLCQHMWIRAPHIKAHFTIFYPLSERKVGPP